jgi:hypothetical protein
LMLFGAVRGSLNQHAQMQRWRLLANAIATTQRGVSESNCQRN